MTALPPSCEAAEIGAEGAPPLVLLEEGHCLRDQVLATCGLDAPPGGGVASLSTLVELVAGGACATLLPELFVHARPGEAARVRIVPFAEPQPARRVVLAWRRTDPARRADGGARRRDGRLARLGRGLARHPLPHRAPVDQPVHHRRDVLLAPVLVVEVIGVIPTSMPRRAVLPRGTGLPASSMPSTVSVPPSSTSQPQPVPNTSPAASAIADFTPARSPNSPATASANAPSGSAGPPAN